MLIIYRKDSGEVIHYVDYNGNVQPTLFGLYHACIKKNYPKLKLEDLGEFKISDNKEVSDGQTIKDKLFDYSVVKVKEKNGKPIDLEFVKKNKSDPLNEPEDKKKEKRIKQLEETIHQQQKAIDELMSIVKSSK